jgi:hypothetical protein
MVTFRSGISSDVGSDTTDYNVTNVPFFRKNIMNKGGHEGTMGPDLSGDSLIHPSFPPMGTEQRAHEGSQSTTPEKGNP